MRPSDYHHLNQQGAHYFYCVCVWGGGECRGGLCAMINIKFKGQLAGSSLPSITWGLGIELRSSGLATGTLPAEPSLQSREPIKCNSFCHLRWLVLVIPAFGRLNQEDCHTCKVSLGYLVRHCLKQPKTSRHHQPQQKQQQKKNSVNKNFNLTRSQYCLLSHIPNYLFILSVKMLHSG